MGSTWITVVLPVVTALVLGAGLVVVFRQQMAVRRRPAPGLLVEPGLDAPLAHAPRRAVRPWWGSPWLWLGVCAMFTILGLYVWPGLIGGAFLFLPFVWIWRPKDAPPDPRSNGHGARD